MTLESESANASESQVPPLPLPLPPVIFERIIQNNCTPPLNVHQLLFSSPIATNYKHLCSFLYLTWTLWYCSIVEWKEINRIGGAFPPPFRKTGILFSKDHRNQRLEEYSISIDYWGDISTNSEEKNVYFKALCC